LTLSRRVDFYLFELKGGNVMDELKSNRQS